MPLPENYSGIKELQDEFLEFQLKVFGQREANFFSLELCGEAGELANLEKKIWKASRKVSKEELSDEAADVFIAVMNYANSRDIDLASAVEEKMRRIYQKKLSKE